MTAVESLILLNTIEGLGIVRLRGLLKIYNSPQVILNNPSKDKLKHVEGIGDIIAGAIIDLAVRDNGQYKEERLNRELDLIKKNNIQIVTIFDENYPSTLKQIYDPPMLLYIKGSIIPEDILAVAVVGSRRASYYGLAAAEKLSTDLAAKGITVVSGLARGIDSAAHRGALKAKGRTMAVLGSGLGVVYPPENKKLFEAIADNSGAIVSEFPYETIPDRKNFPMRNRVISGLSLGVVVVEAAQRSGSLITANVALEQGRDVFSVPGKIDSFNSNGTNNLIKQGAKLVQTADDIIEELEPVLGQYLQDLEKPGLSQDIKNKQAGSNISEKEAKVSLDDSAEGKSVSLKPAGLTQDEQKTYKAISTEPLYIDDIIKQTAFPTSRVSGILMKLELKKLVKQLPGKMFVLS